MFLWIDFVCSPKSNETLIANVIVFRDRFLGGNEVTTVEHPHGVRVLTRKDLRELVF